MFKLKNILLILLIMNNFLSALSQVTGKVVDETNLSLEYVSTAIYNQETNDLVAGVITDINGVFVFDNLKKGNYYLEASFIGYEIKIIKEIKVVRVNKITDLGILQLRLGVTLNEVVIKGERATVTNEIDRQVFEVDKFKSAQGGSGIDVIRNLPSISINGLGEINVRGSSGFVVLLNGKPIQGNASTLMAQFPANAIERVEVITAPSAKYDPEGKAGILNIITKKGAIDGAFGQVNFKGGFRSIETYGNDKAHQRYGIDATYNVRNDKWNVSLGANYQRNDLGGRREGDVYTIIKDIKTQFPSTGERSFDEINYSGRFNLEFTPNLTNLFSAGFFAGKRIKGRLADIIYYDNHAISITDIDNRLYTFQYFNHNLRERKSDFALGSFDYSHMFQNNSKLSSSFLYEYTLLGGPTVNQNLGFSDNSILYQDEFNTNNNPLHGIRLQIDYTFKPFKSGVLEAGYQFRKLDHTGDFVYERRSDFNDGFKLVPEFSSKVNLTRSINAFTVNFQEKVVIGIILLAQELKLWIEPCN
jgi:iron complex outermembrane receptor protein